MNGIRALEPDDLPGVCALYERVVRSGSTEAPTELVDYFRRIFLDCPTADPEIPSLVHEDRSGAIVGFIGSHVRHARFDGHAVRLACSGQLVAAPEPSARGVGALLTGRYLGGPQDLTYTDGATEQMRRIWIGLGGRVATVASVGWARILRPGAVAEAIAAWSGRRGWSRAARTLGLPLDAALRAALRRHPRLLPGTPETSSVPLGPRELADQLRGLAPRLRLYPEYEPAYAAWLFTELAAVHGRGELVGNLVRDATGRDIGWYVYYVAPRAIADVIQIGAAAGRLGPVLDHLFWHADQHGAAAVRGRLEPDLLPELRARLCLTVPTSWSLVHSRDPALLAVLGTSEAMLTRLDGEWWMTPHLLVPSRAAATPRLPAPLRPDSGGARGGPLAVVTGRAATPSPPP
ncbi:MAG TPA: hypothetical protein VD813_12710 [Pseudonocardia sp.]|nr:hypothetical protein [Pseudonocardia sp.]